MLQYAVISFKLMYTNTDELTGGTWIGRTRTNLQKIGSMRYYSTQQQHRGTTHTRSNNTSR